MWPWTSFKVAGVWESKTYGWINYLTKFSDFWIIPISVGWNFVWCQSFLVCWISLLPIIVYISAASVPDCSHANSSQLCSSHQTSHSQSNKHSTHDACVSECPTHWKQPCNKRGQSQFCCPIHQSGASHFSTRCTSITEKCCSCWILSGQIHWFDHGGWCRSTKAARQTSEFVCVFMGV